MKVDLKFIIVGAQKAGTTTLVKYLNNHPDIHIPNKELNFFTDDANYSKGISWYDNLLTKGNVDHKKVIGEKTPRYSVINNAAERIMRIIPT